jgi:hypothetical protein
MGRDEVYPVETYKVSSLLDHVIAYLGHTPYTTALLGAGERYNFYINKGAPVCFVGGLL